MELIDKTFTGVARVKTILDGTETDFILDSKGETILNAAIEHGVDAPYSCKGGICTTCKARLKSGSVRMEANYALTDKEVANGFILACQSHPTSEEVIISWDI